LVEVCLPFFFLVDGVCLFPDGLETFEQSKKAAHKEEGLATQEIEEVLSRMKMNV
jgi:hypothetical protein